MERCGAASLSLECLEKGHYYGTEVRTRALREGRRELRDARLEYKQPVLLLIDDLSLLTLQQQFDIIWAFSVLIHMTDDILRQHMRFVARHLKTTGRLYANVNLGEASEGHWQGFPFVRRSWEFYEEASSQHGMRVSDIGSLKSLGHVSGIELQDEHRMLEFRPIS